MDAQTARLDRQLSAGAEGRYGEDVADRVLAEYFPKPPGGPVNSEDELENVPNGSATLSVPSKNRSLKERGSYTLADGEELPVRVENTQSRLFLEDSDDEHAGDSSKEHGHKRSHSSLKRKKGQYSLRNFSNPRNDYGVQATVGKHHRPDGITKEEQESGLSRSYLIDDSPEPPSLDGVADLRNTEDVTYHSRYAPAVTHQTIYPEIHHIREERIFREVHTHDVFHRILPIVDIEVLPARHFVPVEDGGLREIPEEEVPGRALNHQARNWLVAELVSRRTGNDEGSIQPRQFSAREFPGTEGDERRYTTEDGFERTETTWVHPPTIETGARDSGQSEPLYVLPSRPRETPIGSREGEEASLCSRKSLKNLARCVHDCPFDECAEFEAQAREARRGKSG
ncbi:hypothetical protein MPH_03463 [Macrophomina phaseolina MS6]|uniref:Uncharacterized protein n=1 Tax=Macrophomina phaseolina (strain MS6) TaxID=1126212 RepID=K2SB14_MACPH|nr:hypothetical protein MPH_03463 [Macrophomina phaseolina MS6]